MPTARSSRRAPCCARAVPTPPALPVRAAGRSTRSSSSSPRQRSSPACSRSAARTIRRRAMAHRRRPRRCPCTASAHTTPTAATASTMRSPTAQRTADPTTYWDTEHYNTFQKRGVGVVLDAGRGVNGKTVTVRTDTPGFTASILTGRSPSGPFVTDSASKMVNGSATFALHNQTARYYVVWITDLGPNVSVHVNEVARALQLAARTAGASAARAARARARSAGRRARRTRSPTPRRASRTRSSR